MVPPMTAQSTLISVRVHTHAHTNAVEGWVDGILHIRVRAIAENGKANKAVIEILAKHFSVAKSLIEIVSGSKNANKRIRLPIEISAPKVT